MALRLGSGSLGRAPTGPSCRPPICFPARGGCLCTGGGGGVGVFRSPVMPAAARAAARLAAAFFAALRSAALAAAAAADPAVASVPALGAPAPAAAFCPLWPPRGLLLVRTGCPLISSILRKMPSTRVSRCDAAGHIHTNTQQRPHSATPRLSANNHGASQASCSTALPTLLHAQVSGFSYVVPCKLAVTHLSAQLGPLQTHHPHVLQPLYCLQHPAQPPAWPAGPALHLPRLLPSDPDRGKTRPAAGLHRPVGSSPGPCPTLQGLGLHLPQA